MRFLRLLLALVAGVLVVFPEPAVQVRAAAPGVASAPVPTTRPRIAVIDSGIARTPELADMLIAEYDMAADPARPPFQPATSHGTMVATILLREAARPVELISLRIDDPAGCPGGLTPPCQGDARPIADAIRAAMRLDVDAINISLSVKDDPSIAQAVGEAARRGIKVVLAAGNDGHDRPANLALARAGFPNAILVGAVNPDGRPWSGTNRPEPGTPGYFYVWQEGVRIPTVLADGTEVVATGTSFAAPIETARLLKARRPTGS